MKKSYVYFLIPLVGLIAFGAVYWNFDSKYEAKEQAKKAAIVQARQNKLAEEAKGREQAIKDAIAAQDRRKEERLAKEAKDKADQEARQLAVDAREKANRDQLRLEQQRDRLLKDIKIEQELISKIRDEQKRAVDEQTFLQEYVKQAEANTKSLVSVLDRIAAAEAARAAAEAAAAKAKTS